MLERRVAAAAIAGLVIVWLGFGVGLMINTPSHWTPGEVGMTRLVIFVVMMCCSVLAAVALKWLWTDN